jgi:uncharacterized protein YheU (UPF0270 family)
MAAGSSAVPLTPLTLIPSTQRIPDVLEKVIHDLVCKELTNATAKETLLAATCQKVHAKLKFLPDGACETVARLLWEKEEVAHCKSATVQASEYRRWEGSSDCTGDYSILSTDNMDECTQHLIPAPASIWVEQKNDTAYSSYHCQGVTDCASEKRVFLSDWIVGTCENFGDYSQMRVWVTPKSVPASAGSSEVSLTPLTLIPSSHRIPDALEKVIHDFVCKELTNSTHKDELVATACQTAHDKLKFLPEGACETVAKVLWEHQEVAHCKSTTVKASEHRRWEGSSDCTGDYTILNTDNMDECTQYLIPAPASIWVEQKNDTAYSSYHCQGVTDCASEKRVFLSDWIVGTCENFGDYSQLRVWITPESDEVIMV